jgi:hypothetical protein
LAITIHSTPRCIPSCVYPGDGFMFLCLTTSTKYVKILSVGLYVTCLYVTLS